MSRAARLRLLAAAIMGASTLTTGCEQPEADIPEQGPRPVSVIQLREVNETKGRQYTGSVEAWHQEDLAFEVSGQVTQVVEPGVQIQGPVRDQSGNIVRQGDVLAEIDSTRYENQLEAVQAQYDSVQRQIEALQIEIDGVLPQQVRAAEVELNRVKGEFARVQRAYQAGAATQSMLDQQSAAVGTAEAQLAQAKASISAKQAELRSTEARAKELDAAVARAELDVQDCQLLAPFNGQVSNVRVVNGGIVQAGQPVLNLVMMDPLRIESSVSAETDRAIHKGTVVRLQLANQSGPEGSSYPEGVQPTSQLPVSPIGWVHEKSTVADPATRTFRVRVMVRNRKVELPYLPDVPREVPRISNWSALQPLELRQPDQLFVVNEALYGDSESGYYTWRIDGLTRESVADRFDPFRKLVRVPLELGEQRLDLPGGFVVFSLVDSGGLTAEDLLAVGVPENYQEGQDVLLVQERWLLRPGELVTVHFGQEEGRSGFFVPMAAIVKTGEKNYVFVVDEQSVARRTEVRLVGGGGELRQIEGEAIGPGTRVVVKGAHMLRHDGEEVRAIEEESISALATSIR